MTTDEVKQARERLRGNEDLWIEYGGQHDDLDALLYLAHNDLAEHPADDDEPVTVEWLDALFTRSCKTHSHPNWRASGESRHGFRFVFHDSVLHVGVIFNGTTGIATCKTRGDVRRLCRALGIELKQPEATP